MKRIILLLISLTTLIHANFSFEIKGDSSIIDSDIGTISFYGVIKNTSGAKLQVNVVKINGNDSWISTICVGEKCYAPTTDTVPYQLAIDEEIEVKLNIDCSVEATGAPSVKVINYNNENESSLLSYNATFNKSGSSVNEQLVVLDNELSVYPNPFNPVTTISYSLANASHATVKVFNSAGKVVKVLKSGYQNRGTYHLNFSGRNLASGIYFVNLKSGDVTVTKKMVLLK